MARLSAFTFAGLAWFVSGSGLAAAAAAPANAPAPASAVVGDGVLAAVAAHQKPKVVIYIEPQALDDASATRAEEAAAASGRAAAGAPAPASPASAPPGEAHHRAVIAAAQDRILAAGAAGFTLHRRFAGVPALAGAVDAKALARIRREPGVKRIDLELEAHADLAQSVPLIKADLVRSLGYRGQGMTVGVIDTGIDTDNVDLSDNIEAQACLCLADGGCCPNGGTSQFGPGSAEDNNGHGTHVSGIITSKGIVAPIGVAPDANIVMIKVLDAQGSTCCMSDIVAALDYIHDHQPTVDSINISIGSNAMYGGDCDNADASNMALADAIGALRVAGVPVFVSAGNAGSSAAMSSPACISAAVSVGATYDANVGGLTFGGVPCTDATTAADKIACYSNTDSSTNLLAPGGAITSTYINGQIATLYGTSMAAPHAAACAALLKQADPTLNAAAIETALEATGKKITDPRNNLTFPRIDCLAALQSQACPDADHDGFWAPNPPMCPGPPFSDCNDSDPSIYPGNVEICDFKDNNCNGLVDEGFDPDNDGLVSCADNCPNDYNPDQNDFDHDGQGDACDLDDGVIQVTVPDGLQVSWQMETPYTSFNLYRGDLRSLVDADRNGAADDYGACLAENLSGPTFGDQTAPPVGHGYIYLVDANLTSGETSLGNASSGAVRPNVHDCRSVFGSPPVVSSVSGTTSTQTVTCDITIFSQDRLCLLGVPGAQAMAPILVQGSYTEARLLAQVTDPEGPADLSEVRATLAASTGGNSDLLLYDDASQTVLPEPQRWSDSGEDCGATASCGCPIKVYALSSGDASAADGTSTRVFGLVSASLPAIVQDCVMQARARYPMVAATGAQFTATVTATDRESHTGTSTQQPTFSTGAGSYACSGDPCGCCLLLATDPSGQCKGLAGMTSPDFPAGVCKSL